MDPLIVIESKMSKCLRDLLRGLQSIRSATPSPFLINSVQISRQGAAVPLDFIAAVTTRGSAIEVHPHLPAEIFKIAEGIKAKGYDPLILGDQIRVLFPAQSPAEIEGSIREFHRLGNDAKIAIKKIQNDVESILPSSPLGMADQERTLQDTQALKDYYFKQVNAAIESKERDMAL